MLVLYGVHRPRRLPLPRPGDVPAVDQRLLPEPGALPAAMT